MTIRHHNFTLRKNLKKKTNETGLDKEDDTPIKD